MHVTCFNVLKTNLLIFEKQKQNTPKKTEIKNMLLDIVLQAQNRK